MSHDNTLFEPSYDPHGYQPIAIDEDILTPEDRREAVIEAVARPRDWTSFLTPKELDALWNAFEVVSKKPPFCYSDRELTEYSNMRMEMARLGMFRAFARDKFNNGRRIWFGDGGPFK